MRLLNVMGRAAVYCATLGFDPHLAHLFQPENITTSKRHNATQSQSVVSPLLKPPTPVRTNYQGANVLETAKLE
jgi:hypothetical protein